MIKFTDPAKDYIFNKIKNDTNICLVISISGYACNGPSLIANLDDSCDRAKAVNVEGISCLADNQVLDMTKGFGHVIVDISTDGNSYELFAYFSGMRYGVC